MTANVQTVHSILHCTGSTCTHLFDTISTVTNCTVTTSTHTVTTSTVTISTVTISTVTITSARAIRVKVSLFLHFMSLITYSLKNYPLIVKGSAFQAVIPSTSQQAADRDATNVTYKILVLVFLVVAILLAITSVALGAMLYHTRKTVKSVPGSKLKQHEGKFATPFNDYIHILYIGIHTYIL